MFSWKHNSVSIGLKGCVVSVQSFNDIALFTAWIWSSFNDSLLISSILIALGSACDNIQFTYWFAVVENLLISFGAEQDNLERGSAMLLLPGR